MDNEIAILLDDIKKLTGLTQKQIAEKAGYDEKYLSQLANSHKKASKKSIEKLRLAFHEKLEKEDDAIDLGSAKATYTNKSGNDFIELSGGKYIMNTPLITKKAYAGYLAGWGDDEYINDLPKHPIVVDKPHLGYYRSFEVAGDSMDDGSSKAIQEGDIVTGRKIDRSFWKNKLHISKFAEYIIVSLEGILVKEIIKHDAEAGIIVCRSYNQDKGKYPDFELQLAKVIQIFNVVQVTKKR